MSQQLRVYQLPSSRHLEVLLRRMATDQAPHGVSYRGGLRKQVHTTLPTSARRQSAQRARTYKGTPFAHVSKLGRGCGGGSGLAGDLRHMLTLTVLLAVQMLILDQINAFYWIDMLEGEEPRTFKAICTHLSKLDMSIFASKVCACCRLPSPAFPGS
jgi:hypothetical protein